MVPVKNKLAAPYDKTHFENHLKIIMCMEVF